MLDSVHSQEDEFISMTATDATGCTCMDGVLVIQQKTGQVSLLKQLQQRRHARNIKAVIKHCTEDTLLLSQCPYNRSSMLMSWIMNQLEDLT